MVEPEERDAYGFLGKPPQNLWLASHDSVAAWKDLAIEAKHVASLRPGDHKTERAKKVEDKYHQLVRQIDKEVAARG